MLDKRQFPSYHHHQAGKEKAPAEEVSDEKHGRKHHEISPVEDSAVYAALILDEKALERTPQHHADQVADVVESSQQYQFLAADDVGNVKQTEDCVETEPYQQHFQRGEIVSLYVSVHFQFVVIRHRMVVAHETFFAAHGDSLALREHLHNHAEHKNRPDYVNPQYVVFVQHLLNLHHGIALGNPLQLNIFGPYKVEITRLEDVCCHHHQKDDAAEHKLAHVFFKHVDFFHNKE